MPTFTPFPLRTRASLEIFDAAIKLYKQYFWVLLGWSAIVSGATLFGAILPGGGLAAMFITPVAIGSVVCCIAAAVRGQSVEFGQCWRFTQPRYWTMLGMHLLASLLGSLVIALVVGLFSVIVIGGVYTFRQSSGVVQAVMATLAFVVLGTVGTIVGTVFMSWMGMVPIVVCMEENNRGTAALGRAYEILRGHWLRITSVMALVGLGMLALLAILGGLAAMAVGIGRVGDLMAGRGATDGVIWMGIGAMSLAYIVLWIAWTPLYYLILSVFYLDVRVRQEALDLEWTAHTTAPAAAPVSAQPAYSPQLEYSPPAMTSVSPTAPATSAPSYGTRPLSDEFPNPSTPVPNMSVPPAPAPSTPAVPNAAPPAEFPDASTPEPPRPASPW